ncbi:hypothetical protein AAKU55_001412 [Oxalobacteraceae bacterium GrIS 1.11]
MIVGAKRGVEVELLRTILDLAGYQADLLFVPNKRAHMSLAIGTIDAAIAAGTEANFLID